MPTFGQIELLKTNNLKLNLELRKSNIKLKTSSTKLLYPTPLNAAERITQLLV